jgi:hypothetical protein
MHYTYKHSGMHLFNLVSHDNRALWENEEALNKYLNRLKELMEEDENKKPVEETSPEVTKGSPPSCAEQI